MSKKTRSYSAREVRQHLKELERRVEAMKDHAPLNLWPHDERYGIECEINDIFATLRVTLLHLYNLPNQPINR